MVGRRCRRGSRHEEDLSLQGSRGGEMELLKRIRDGSHDHDRSGELLIDRQLLGILSTPCIG